MTLVRIALRSHRTGLVGATVIASLFALGNTFGYAQIAGGSPAERAVFAQQMTLLGRQLSFMLPIPIELDTMSGYLQWRHFGNLPLVYGFWALLAATGAGRGDEERGLVEQWLAAGVARSTYFAARVVAFAACAVLSVLVMLAVVSFSATAGGEPIAAGVLAQQGLALFSLSLCCFGIALVVAQLAGTRRAATGAGAVVLLVLFLVNSASRVGEVPAALRVLSPFWAYERSTPLVRGGTLDVASTAGLLLAAFALVAIAAVAFRTRDLGAPLLRPRRGTGPATTRPARDPLLRLPVLAIVGQQRVALAAWALGLAALAAYLVSLARSIVDTLLTTAAAPALRLYFERAGITAYESFIGVIWLSTALLILSVYAIAQVNGWSADDAEGRLEVALAQPISRTRVVLERLGILLVGAAVVIAAGSVSALAAAKAQEIPLDTGRFALASALMLPVVFAFGAIGATIAGWRPRVAVVGLSAVTALSYFAQQFAPLFDWSDQVRDLSFFALYGNPLVEVDRRGIGILIAIGMLGSVLAAVAMRRRDVGR